MNHFREHKVGGFHHDQEPRAQGESSLSACTTAGDSHAISVLTLEEASPAFYREGQRGAETEISWEVDELGLEPGFSRSVHVSLHGAASLCSGSVTYPPPQTWSVFETLAQLFGA